MKIFSKQSNSVHLLRQFKQTEFSSLHRFNHVLCSLIRAGVIVLLFQYNLVSGTIDVSTLEDDQKYYGCDEPLICCDSNKLFVISKVKDVIKDTSLSLSAFHKNKFTDCLEMCKEKTFEIFLHTKYEHSKLWLSHCHDDKLYIFYSCYKHRRTYGGGYSTQDAYNSDDLYLLTICNKSFDILENQRLSERIEIDKFINLTNFETMFYHEKQEKLFMLQTCFYFYEQFEQVLVFDMKNNSFYFTHSILPSSPPIDDYHQIVYAFSKDGSVYVIGQYHRLISELELQHWTEIRSFQLENDELVGGELQWRGAEDSVYPEVTSGCFV